MKSVKKTPIIILHGWAPTMTGGRYKEVQQLLEKQGWVVYAPDLPGFGKELLRGEAMGIDDYVAFVNEFLKKHKMRNVIFIGHSFGGRIAAKFALLYPEKVAKLIICSSPLIRQKLSFKKRLVALVAKTGKGALALFPSMIQDGARKVLYRSINEWDYYTSQGLRQTFLRVINEDLHPYLKDIQTESLIIWGENDTFVPLSIGRAIAKQMPHATLVIVPNAGHKLPYDQPEAFVTALVHYV